jgi:stage II sporulation protein AB (anti-sigma F factor)
MNNFMKLQFAAISTNEAFARVSVAAFIAQLDPTIEQMTDIKTVVSEAVTNAIIHGYEENPIGIITVSAKIECDTVYICIEDAGKGIQDVEEARQPLYTSKPEMERSGMGFTIMENFMDEVVVHSGVGMGTRIEMMKHMSCNEIPAN